MHRHPAGKGQIRRGWGDANLIFQIQAPQTLVYREQKPTHPTCSQAHMGAQALLGTHKIIRKEFSAGTFNLVEEKGHTHTQTRKHTGKNMQIQRCGSMEQMRSVIASLKTRSQLPSFRATELYVRPWHVKM